MANSIIDGVTNIFEKYDKLIVCEDDLILSPLFLKYMNECLNYYRYDNRIWWIGAYSELDIKAVNKNYPLNVYVTYGCSTWGWGTWKERRTDIEWNIKSYYWKFLLFPKYRHRINRSFNTGFSMLRAQNKGKLDSWATRRLCYMNMSSYQLGLYPVHSLVKYNGFGSDATHTKKCLWKIKM